MITWLGVSANIMFEKKDCWIGVFWRHYADYKYASWHLWICLLPCLPIHVMWPVHRDSRALAQFRRSK